MENKQMKCIKEESCLHCGSNYCRFVDELDQLKAEKEEIKKYLGISSKTIMERLEELQEFRDNNNYKLYQAEQTLAEIKEIAKNMNEECFYDDFDCMNCDMQNGCTYFNKKQILQKISECEVENDNK